MKKVITLVLFFGIAGGAFAQSDAERAAGVILRGGVPNAERYPQGQYPSGSQQDAINAINRDYDARVAAVQADPNISAAERERRIQALNRERARRIDAVNRRNGQGTRDRDYDHDRDRDHDRNDRMKKNGKDNGNHYGWEKGKGNPHGNGNWKHKNKNKD
ncbi:hypothetical protein EPD60_15160 [Flaviaesturariibacter flavus]|uniref:DUF4148 domain-containing protein n=1 Tax=Flaviaesturariibacter flavus TaxID=2502780 RepID=A0A4R1B830_9BACT|nr:hypothetical protein [Flaviaesturariibacter flavus]TCJ12605.1 hypothetical protein EPD60_15160 [Flaviaesturariibacter flavus]